MAKVVIIGAGLTGISTAYHLEQRNFFDYILFEKESSIGGLCRSVGQDGFTFDYTGHLLHVNDPYFDKLIASIGKEHFNAISRKSFIYSHETYTPYPFQINLHGLPTNIIAECIREFVIKKKTKKKAIMFKDWVLQEFGAGFAKHFFFGYQEKIFAYDLDKITASWTGRFVPNTSLENIIEGIYKTEQEKNIGYNAQFIYPKHGGIIWWVEQLAQKIKQPIRTNCCLQSVDLKNKVLTFTNGHEESYETLITTIPLDRFITQLKDLPSTTFKRAQSKLLCNSVINFNLGINRDNLSDKHWIYYPESKFSFYRLGFWHNFAQSMVPTGCSSLYGEISFLNKSNKWIQDQVSKAITQIKKLFSITEDDIVTKKALLVSHAYVIFDQWREKNLPALHKALHEKNIFSIGRYGEWKYSSMQEAVLDGKKMAEMLTIVPAIYSHTKSSHIKKRNAIVANQDQSHE